MKKLIVLIILLSISLYPTNNIVTRADIIYYRNAIIDVDHGINWKSNTVYGSLSPQLAIWVQDFGDTFVQNIYVTRAFAQQNMEGIPPGFLAVFARKSLPFWLKKNYTDDRLYPTIEESIPDIISRPTPSKSFTIETRIVDTLNKGYVYLEVNHLGDTNSRFDSIDGQPSLIYRVLVDFRKYNKVYDFELFAMSDNVREGLYTTNIRGITTASKIINKATITILK